METLEDKHKTRANEFYEAKKKNIVRVARKGRLRLPCFTLAWTCVCIARAPYLAFVWLCTSVLGCAPHMDSCR